MQDITLKTEDDISIKGIFYESEKKEKGVILLHMRGRNKETWNEFADFLQGNNFNALAIDFRGHGKSEGNWKNFSENDYKNMILDTRAAFQFLKEKNPEMEISVLGASIGANTAFNFALRNKEIKTVILMAPGINYLGVDLKEAMENYNNERRVLVVLSKDDKYFETGKEVFDGIKTNNKQVKIYENGGHGTELFISQPEIKNLLVDYLK